MGGNLTFERKGIELHDYIFVRRVPNVREIVFKKSDENKVRLPDSAIFPAKIL